MVVKFGRYSEKEEKIPFPFNRVFAWGANRYFTGFYRDVAEEIASCFNKAKVLDLGTANGLLPFSLINISDNFNICGIDLSKDMMRLAFKGQRKLPEKMARNLDFRVMDARALDFEEKQFDLVISLQTLHHWEQPEEIFSEIARVLIDKGQAWIYDFRPTVSDDEMLTIVKKFPLLRWGFLPSIERSLSKEHILAINEKDRLFDITIEDFDMRIGKVKFPKVMYKIIMKKNS